GVGIGVDAHHAAKVERMLMPTPVQVQAPWIGVDLHCNAVLGAGPENLLDVNVVARATEQLPAGHVPQDRHSRVGDSPQDAIRLLIAAGLNRLCTLATTKSKRANTSSG